MKSYLALSLIAVLLVPGLAVAQEEKKTDPVADWVNVLVAKMADKNETVARSVERAITTVGEAAVPALEKVAAGKDAALAEKAKGMIERIKNPRSRRGDRSGRGNERGGRGGERGRGGFGGRSRNPFEGMDLNEEQQGKVDKIQASQREKSTEMFEAMRNGELDRSEIREAMQELRDEANKEYKKVLTEEQYKKYEEQSQRRGRRRGGDG